MADAPTTAAKTPVSKPVVDPHDAAHVAQHPLSTKSAPPPLDDQRAAALARAFASEALPGEAEGFEGDAVGHAAVFALAAAQTREPGRPAIRIDSVSRGDARFLRVAIINDDMPFLVDSIAMTLASFGLVIDRLIHPVLAVRRDAAGQLTAILDGDAEGERRESFVYVECDRADAKIRREAQKALERALGDVRAAVDDWTAMKAQMAADADGLGDSEGAALLRWFGHGALTMLGHVARHRDGTTSNALGLSRGSVPALLADASYDRAFAWFDEGGQAPLVIKSNVISTVHRRTPLDLFIVPVRRDGAIEALSVHAGVWTSASLAAPPDKVPMLRAHLRALMEKYEFPANGHAGKALVHALTALPHDLLLGFKGADLERVALAAMSLADRPRPKLVLVRSALHRHLFAFAWLPRDEMSTARRKSVEAMLGEATNASTLSWTTSMEGDDVALMRYTLDLRDSGVVIDEDALDKRFQAMVRGWPHSVEDALVQAGEGNRSAALAARYADAFPIAYRDRNGADEAAADILRIQGLRSADLLGARLHRFADDQAGHLRLKLYSARGAVPLSKAVPALENFGFNVLEEVPTELSGGPGYIHDFLLETRRGQPAAPLLARSGTIETAIAAVLNNAAENDLFSQLIASAGLDPRSVIWLRAWYRYLRQAGLSYGIATVVDALGAAPQVAGGLIDLFEARHDPAFANDREAAAATAIEAIREGLTKVAAIADDRLLRRYRDLVMAILRTNAFAPAADEALAFKIDSGALPGLVKPVPWREIFVYSPVVEGIHLRAGPVARGGLRWSDRRDDYRTEILGLMKAQRVKNAVIVPTGAKGGFYPKQLPDPANRDAWLAGGKAAYQIFIRTLLSVTDNIVEGKVVHPDLVVVRDGEDPYFVVAADKGTATFSDVANAIALERGFWLGDAFASGGSNGYDHKAMGITARGAWISVQRHFLEMGVDVQSDSVRVVGVGDMSGDVFGNGMLLSKAIRLVAAFDHRHIFIDPDPDAAKSWAERDRLFALPRSSWDDYDKSLISKGGGVFPRTLKSIDLSDEMRALIGSDAESLDPDGLISALLKAQVDLLWFGGIGTYVKAAAENNVTVGDPANDALRVDAEDLRARAIGEGANLGITQAARIAFAGLGGRINTDFIDNSAGVDCSDNEVNIKIALDAAVRAGKLDGEARNVFLAEMTDAVAEIVLEDNRLQTLGLSIAEAGGGDAVPSYVRLIEMFEERGRLDRAVEGLGANDVLQRRAAEGRGLTRPELAVLFSTAKLSIQDAVESHPSMFDETMNEELLAAFPPAMQARFPDAIKAHRLAHEIIATKLANRIVNRLGIVHPFELAEEEGSSLGHVAVAFVAAERLFAAAPIWNSIEDAAMSENARLALFERAAWALRSHIADLLRASQDSSRPGDLVDALEPGVRKLSSHAGQLLGGEARTHSDRIVGELTALGAPKGKRRRSRISDLDGAVGLARLARVNGIDAETLTRSFSRLGQVMGLDWAQLAAARMSPSDPWERLLVAGLARDFQQMRLEFLARAGQGDPTDYVGLWADQQAPRIRQFRSLVERAQRAPDAGVAMLAQIASQARNLLAR